MEAFLSVRMMSVRQACMTAPGVRLDDGRALSTNMAASNVALGVCYLSGNSLDESATSMCAVI
jgi:hypothetical protein